jgi:hypothetical protein
MINRSSKPQEIKMLATYVFIVCSAMAVDAIGRLILTRKSIFVYLAGFEALAAALAFAYKMGWWP